LTPGVSGGASVDWADMRISFGSDHAGFALKEVLKAEVTQMGHEVHDLGTFNGEDSVDYPDFGAAVGRAVVSGQADLGICTCGSGIGISMAANKVGGIRAAVVHDVTTATLAKQHNHANVLCLGSRTTGPAVALDALHAFLSATEEHGRHDGRIAKLATLDREGTP
jgi:RpiB/LacA/LacB family sugar-phosphate isomerase